MSEITNEQVHAVRTELLTALRPHTSTPLMQRINAYVFNATGKKLPEFLGGDGPNEKKHSVVTELIEILKAGDYTKLPTAPTGQAQTPEATAPKQPAAPKPEAPKPVAKPAPVPVIEEVVVATDDLPAEDDDPDVIALQLKLAQAKAAAAKKVAAPVGLTPDALRALMREEFSTEGSAFRLMLDEHIEAMVDARLAALFSTITSTLKKE